jgi:hypothetical protein
VNNLKANSLLPDKPAYLFCGFFHPLPSLSIVPFSLSFRVSSRLAVTIHSMYSFLLVKERELKNAAPLFLIYQQPMWP